MPTRLDPMIPSNPEILYMDIDIDRDMYLYRYLYGYIDI